MQKWSERPPSEDAFEASLQSYLAFLSKHASLLVKALPPLLGFGIFLAYFYQNRFYPSFDLFQFSSLLVSAAFIGFAIVGSLIATMLLPGVILFHWFINTREIKEDIQYAMPYSADKRGNAVLQLVGLTYFGPFSLCGLGLVAALVIDSGYVLWTILLWPALIAIIFGTVLKWRFDLSRKSIVSFSCIAYMALLMVMLLLLSILQSSAPFIDKLDHGWQDLVLWAIPILMALVLTLCAAGHFGGWNIAIHFSLLLGIAVAAYSGILIAVPEKAVKGLGLGAYDAEIIMLDPAFCDRDVSELGIDEDCTLRNVHVVWSFGDSILLRPALDQPRHVQIPTEFVRSIVQSTNRGK